MSASFCHTESNRSAMGLSFAVVRFPILKDWASSSSSPTMYQMIWAMSSAMDLAGYLPSVRTSFLSLIL